MKKLRILVLTHESLVPPESLDGYTDQEIDEWETEYDVIQVLREAEHEVRVLGMYDNLGDLRRAIQEWKPDVAFNLLQEFQGIVTYDQHIAAYLELMRQPYTGCNPRGMMLSRDKVLSKQILTYHRIPTPRFYVFHLGQAFRAPRKLAFPLFVKSATEDASLGISQASIVADVRHLQERVEFIHQHTKTDALVEEYIEGRELYVAIDGNKRLRTYPVWELNFGTLSSTMAGIATRKVKWDRNYQEKHAIQTGVAEDLSDSIREKLKNYSKRIYKALYMSGYARMDFRLRADGELFLLEANCNPNLCDGEDFSAAADAGGVEYDALIHRIIRHGLSYQAEWRLNEA